MDKSKVIIHIGYHKCGSTFLQDIFFRQLSVDYLYLSGGMERKLLNYVQSSNGFDADYFRDMVSKAISVHKFDTLILSHEELSGCPIGSNRLDPFRIADNLYRAYPEARILIIVRNQTSFLRSIYAYRVVGKGCETRSLKRYIDEEGPRGLFEKIEYHKLLSYYVELYGKDKILVLPLELLSKDYDIFCRKITSFVGVDNNTIKNEQVNVSVSSPLTIAIFRVLNVFIKILVFMILKIFPYPSGTKIKFVLYRKKMKFALRLSRLLKEKGKIAVDGLIPDAILERYKRSNSDLQKFVDIDLKALGYIC